MKHLKNFENNTLYEAYLEEGVDYPVVAKAGEQVYALTTPPPPP